MPKYISGKKLQWKRFWVPWDGEIRCGHDGRSYLDDPEEDLGKYYNPQARQTDQLREKRCAILSGHPGIGKTTEVESIHEQLLRGKNSADEIFSFHCRAIASVEMLRRETIDHPRWITARSTGGKITLIVDGVDEGLRKVPEFVGALTLLLRDEPNDRLQLFLVCRSAEWDVSEGSKLMSLWKENDASGIFELCPLRRCDVQEAARAFGIEETIFLQSVYQHRIEGLAARPLTLRMLLEGFSGGDFPDTRMELYSAACLRMCDEFDEDRLKSLRKHYTPLPTIEVHRTTSRLAALLMLTGKNVVLKRKEEKPSEIELHGKTACGGDETIEGRTFSVTEQHVEAALETAHFSFRGPFRYGFDHPAFAEFLAADYLAKFSLVQLRQLLCRRFDGRETVVPQLAEVAAWLGLSHLEWRNFLIHSEPLILLRTDVSRFSDTEKEALVASLLQHAEKEEAFDDSWNATFYHTLRHPRIAEQLRPYIADITRNIVARRISIEIAGEAKISELEPDLWKILSPADPAYNTITRSLRDLTGMQSKRYLLKAIQGGFPEDKNMELFGIALRVLVPNLLSVKTVLPKLPLRDDKFYSGSFDWALKSHLPAQLTRQDLPVLLRHLIKWDHCFNGASQFYPLAIRGFSLALDHLESTTIRTLMVNLWLHKLNKCDDLPGKHHDLKAKRASGLTDDFRRRIFARAMLNDKRTGVFDIIRSSVPLLASEDLGWLLQELPHAPKQYRLKWAEVIAKLLLRTNHRPHQDVLRERYESIPELRKYLPPARKGDICLTLSRFERAVVLRSERQQKRLKTPKKGASRRELLENILDFHSKWGASMWVRIYEVCFLRDNGVEVNDRFDITSSHGWQQLNDVEKTKFKSAARRFLVECDDKRLSPKTQTNFTEAGYHALRLLRAEITSDVRLRQAVKKKWLSAITDFFNNAEEKHQEMVAFAYALDPHLTTARLLLHLKISDKEHGFALALNAFEQSWCNALSRSVSSFLLSRFHRLKAETIKSILLFLINNDRVFALSIIHRLLGKAKGRILSSQRLRSTVSVALFSCPDTFGGILWPGFTQASIPNQKLFFLESANEFRRGELKVFENMDDKQIGNLYLLLFKIFPPDEDKVRTPGEVEVVSDDSKIRGLRDGCIVALSNRATKGSIAELDRLAILSPPGNRSWIRWRRVQAIRGLIRKLWTETAPTANDVLSLARSVTSRRVEDEESMREAVISSLCRLQAEMDKDGLPSSRELWNDENSRQGTPAAPKHEETLSHLIGRWLKHDLPAKTGIIVNCEVKVTRFGQGKLDIKIEAAIAAKRIAIIIEVKRCNHKDVDTACKTQLVDGYLLDEGLSHGIYLVGWFGSSARPCVKWNTLDEAKQTVEAWAQIASQPGRNAQGFVLDCRMRDNTAPSKRKQPIKGKV